MNNHRGIIVSIILCGALVFSGLFYLASAINNKVFTSTFPSAISVDTGNGEMDVMEARDYMYPQMAMYYIGMFDYDRFMEMVRNGTFDGTYTTYRSSTEVSYIFSKSKLDAFMEQKIQNGESIK